MKNMLIFGASIVHGVGGAHGGWADKIKQSFHADMFGPNGKAGGHCDVYELGIPGAPLSMLMKRFESELLARLGSAEPGELCVVFSAGTNDSRLHSDGSQVTAAEEFAATARQFIQLAKKHSGHIVGIGITPVDEATINRQDGTTYLFSNHRLQTFEQTLHAACDAENVQFVPLFGSAPADWQQTHMFVDGLHPNDQGYEWIRAQVEPVLRDITGTLT